MLFLYKALKNSIRIDSHPWFYDTFEIYRKAHWHLDFLVNLYQATKKFPPIELSITFLYGLTSAMRHDIRGEGPILASNVTKNETDAVKGFLAENKIQATAVFGKRPVFWYNMLFFCLVAKRAVSIWRILKLLGAQNTLAKLRASELVFLYCKFDGVYDLKRYQEVFISSVSSPYALVLNVLCEKHGTKCTYIDHGFYFNKLANLKFHLCAFTWPFNRIMFESSGCQCARLLVKTKNIPKIKVQNIKTIGVFLPKIYDKEILRKIKGPRFFGRPHPLDLIAPGQFKASKGIEKDIARSDLGVSGSSSVLIDLLLAGKPAAYISEVDIAQQEGYEFVKIGLVPEFKKLEDINEDKIKAFYSSKEFKDAARKCFGTE